MSSPLRLHVLPLQWPDLGHVYTMAEIWPRLAQADLGRALFVFETEDFRAYDWEHQEIWLTDQAVTKVIEARVDRLLRDVVGRAFVVTLLDEPLYGGLFYYEGGAAAIRFPVIHAIGDPISVLRIRPALGYGWDPTEPYLAPQCEAIANPQLADWLAQEELLRTIPEAKRPRDPCARGT